MFLLLARFNHQLMSYKALILAFTTDIFDKKGVIRVEEEKFRLPVDVRGSKTSVLKLSIPGDLVTSLRETGEKILLPYPIRQPARSRESLPGRMLMLFRFLPYTTIGIRNFALNRRSVDLDSWEVSFSSTVNLFNAHHAALAASYCKLKNHLVFYFD